VISSAVW